MLKCPHVLRKYARLSTKLGFALVSASEQDQLERYYNMW